MEDITGERADKILVNFQLSEGWIVRLPLLLEVAVSLHWFVVLRSLLRVLLHQVIILFHCRLQVAQDARLLVASLFYFLERLHFRVLAERVRDFLLQLAIDSAVAETKRLPQAKLAVCENLDRLLLFLLLLSHHNHGISFVAVSFRLFGMLPNQAVRLLEHLLPLVTLLALDDQIQHLAHFRVAELAAGPIRRLIPCLNFVFFMRVHRCD